MAQFTDAWLEYQRRRFQRHDAHRWWRPDADRYKAYNPDQPRVSAGSPEGGQWTSDEANNERPSPAQFSPRPQIPSTERLLRQGWRSLGHVAPRVLVVVSPGVEEDEGFDDYTGHITVSLTGIGEAIVVEEFGTEAIVSRYEVGSAVSPDRGLSIRIDPAGNVFVTPTFGT